MHHKTLLSPNFHSLLPQLNKEGLERGSCIELSVKESRFIQKQHLNRKFWEAWRNGFEHSKEHKLKVKYYVKASFLRC